MKKIYLLFGFSVLTTVCATAQFEKGQALLGGNVGFSIGKNDDVYGNTYTSAFTNVSVNPSIGIFRKPNVLRGAGLMYDYSSQKNKSQQGSQETNPQNYSVGISLFSQRFFVLAQNLFFTVHSSVGVGYSFGKQVTTAPGSRSETKHNGYSANLAIAPGLSYRLTPRLLFDAYLSNLVHAGYSHRQTKYKNPTVPDLKSVQNTFSISSSLSNTSLSNVGLGFRWLLKKG